MTSIQENQYVSNTSRILIGHRQWYGATSDGMGPQAMVYGAIGNGIWGHRQWCGATSNGMGPQIMVWGHKQWCRDMMDDR